MKVCGRDPRLPQKQPPKAGPALEPSEFRRSVCRCPGATTARRQTGASNRSYTCALSNCNTR